MSEFAGRRFDVIVVGGGPAALALALAARNAGGKVLRLGADSPPAGRHYALGLRARRFLKNIGAEIPQSAVVNRFWLFSGGRKAEVCAEESGLDSLCNVVSESALLDSLQSANRGIPHVDAAPDSISNLHGGADGATIHANGESFGASLLAAADGARSRMAALAGAGVFARPFGQSALTATLRAPLPADVAAQWFSRGSVLALLPICGEERAEGAEGAEGVFSLIWSVPHEEARRLAAGGADEIARAVSQRTGMAGIEAVGEGVGERVGEGDGGAGAFPLAAMRRAVRAWGRVDRRRRAGDSSAGGAGFEFGAAGRGGFNCAGVAVCGWGDESALASHAASRVWRAEALHRTTRFFAECGDDAAAGILTAANCIRPAGGAGFEFGAAGRGGL